MQLHLDCVLFVPAGDPPHKLEQTLSLTADRVAMVQAAIADHPNFVLSRVDVEREGPHYTAKTLAILRTRHPRVAAWFFLMGEDALHDLPRWRNPESILQHAALAVMPRDKHPTDLGELTRALPQLAGRLVWLDVPPLHISATALRRRVRQGLPLRYLVPSSVEDHIQQHNLYG